MKTFKFLICIIILSFSFAQIEDGCDLPLNNLYLSDSGDVFYNSSDDIGGFQFNVDGATIVSASGGDAATYGFTVSAGGTTVLGFSFTGGVVPSGCGTLVELDLNGSASGLSGIIMSDSTGNALDFDYYDGGGVVDICEDDSACNTGNPDISFTENNVLPNIAYKC